ncbi:hypothetical protein RhiirA4_450349 [Rhizophagus irregularis]|uniref:Uncharacterized protein n=1 Tax=Rhizophagus irregularis TaxID=588596 RepID=A0A2I1FSZ7_9GLOM|nr:hypothetical protein RhiirA4_450349 [Rhizophagus irregularis]
MSLTHSHSLSTSLYPVSICVTLENQKVDDDDDDEIPVIPVKKAANALKYLQVVRVKEFNLKRQSTLDLFLNDCGMK